MSNYKSENQEDQWLDENVFKGKVGGFFCELGAVEGLTSSNTFFFEKCREWRGILIEAHLENFSKISQNRNCVAVNEVVGVDGDTVEFISYERGSLSGIKGVSSPINTFLKEPARYDTLGYKTEKRTAVSLTSILKQCNAPFHIDLLSLDVEGSEGQVLKGLDFSLFSFTALVIETKNFSSNILDFLGGNYREVVKLGGNTIFLHESFSQQ